MTRRTSILSYHEVMESGLVGKRQRQIYDILYRRGPLTANQTWDILAIELGGLRFDSNTRARFTELRELDLVYEAGETTDPITKKTVILWDVTENKPPEERPIKITKDKIINDQKKEIEWLKQQLSHAQDEIRRLKSGELF